MLLLAAAAASEAAVGMRWLGTQTPPSMTWHLRLLTQLQRRTSVAWARRQARATSMGCVRDHDHVTRFAFRLRVLFVRAQCRGAESQGGRWIMLKQEGQTCRCTWRRIRTDVWRVTE